MVEIIPAILEHTIERVQKRLQQVESLAEQVQIDIADGVYVPNKTEFSAEEFLTLETTAMIELHMMVRNPEEGLERWCTHPQLNRIIVHPDATSKMDMLMGLARSCGKEVGIALNPELTIQDVEQLLAKVDAVQIMGIHPGFSGQAFIPSVLAKIRQLRTMHPQIPISADGGLTLENVGEVVKSGVTRLVTYTLIFHNDNVEANMKTIKQKIV